MRGPQYAADLAAMKQTIQDIQNNCWAILKTLDTATPEMLNDCGYSGKTNAEAMQLAFRDKKKQVSKVLEKFLVKYPD